MRTAGAFAGAAPVSATTVRTGDVCVIYPDAVQTPLGTITVTANAANVVTVHPEPSAPNTFVVGLPFSTPPGPPCQPSYCRTTIDTFQMPPGPPS